MDCIQIRQFSPVFRHSTARISLWVELLVIILLVTSGCQSPTQTLTSDSHAEVIPTLFQPSTAVVAASPFPTRLLRAVPTRLITSTHTQVPTTTPLPTLAVSPSAALQLLTRAPVTEIRAASVSGTAVGALANGSPEYLVFGQSARRRELAAWRFGTGRTIMLVGGIHGGWEANTVDLMNALVAHFQASPGDVLAGISLVIIPSLNPDGLSQGRVLEGRFNANAVDLNRNWGCGWEPVAYFRSQEVSPGAAPFSEPETQTLSTWITQLNPSVVLFYHSAADGIFAGGCAGDDGGSERMAAVYGEASGYSYGADFTAYPVTGTAPAWVSSLGIPSADVELATWRSAEFDRNLRAVMALQCWILGGVPGCA